METAICEWLREHTQRELECQTAGDIASDGMVSAVLPNGYGSNLVWVMVASVWMASVAGLVAAEPPVLSGLVVLPDTLEVGTKDQTVNISVRVSDPDDDLKNVKVKQIIEGEKNPTLARLVDDGSNGDVAAGDGRFTANVTFTTELAEVIQYEDQGQGSGEGEGYAENDPVSNAGSVYHPMDANWAGR